MEERWCWQGTPLHKFKGKGCETMAYPITIVDGRPSAGFVAGGQNCKLSPGKRDYRPLAQFRPLRQSRRRGLHLTCGPLSGRSPQSVQRVCPNSSVPARENTWTSPSWHRLCPPSIWAGDRVPGRSSRWRSTLCAGRTRKGVYWGGPIPAPPGGRSGVFWPGSVSARGTPSGDNLYKTQRR